MIDWRRGFSAMYDLKRIDPVSWRDAGSFDFVTGRVERDAEGLMESADLEMTENPLECWVRVYLKARQGDQGERVPIFTGITSTPEKAINGTKSVYKVECYSVLKPAQDTLVKRGYYAPSGLEAAVLAGELLKVGPAPVVIEPGSPGLADAIVAEDDMTCLDMAWAILDAIGWRIRIDGDGTINVCPAATSISATFDAINNDIIEPDITDTQDWYSVPNCIRVVSGDSCVELTDDDPGNPLSTVARKAARGGNGEIWMYDSASSIGSRESLSEYAVRVLTSAQAPSRKISYPRRFVPDVYVSDNVALQLARYGIDGKFRITGQTITLGYGCRTYEEVVAVE